MRRILPCIQDAYVTSKIVQGSRVYDSNTGQAGTLDLYKLFDETFLSGTVAPVEISRGLLKFDLSSISSSNLTQPNFKCFLRLSDIYSGHPVPSNYTLSLAPLARSFQEGRGIDVIGYRDIDATNWLSSSVGNLWASGGVMASGTLGTSDLDYYVSGTLSPSIGSVPLWVTQSFARGDENLCMDVTTLVSGVVAGVIPDYGFRLSYTPSEEENETTYFVKRFSTRHTRDHLTHPRIDLHFDDSTTDTSLNAYFNRQNKIYIFNRPFGTNEDFYSGSFPMSGSSPLMLTLVGSKSINVLTTSYSDTHKANVTYYSSSFVYFSSSFTGSREQEGIYYATFSLDSNSDYLKSFLANDEKASFLPLWQSLDRTVTFTSASYLTIKKMIGTASNVAERNFMMNIINLKYQYSKNEIVRFRVFVQDFNTDLRHNMIPVELASEVYANMHWRLKVPYSQQIAIPFDTVYNGTKLSSDGEGMYFDMHMEDLEINQMYELEFLIRENNRDYLILNQGFSFKVIE